MMRYALLFLFVWIWISSCSIIDRFRVNGNGTIITKTYDRKSFSSIKVGSALKVSLKQDFSCNVSIETDENLQDYLDVKVEGGETLVVKKKEDVMLNPTKEIKIHISMPKADKVYISGASSIKTEGKFSQKEKIRFKILGASSGNFIVRAPVIDMEADGASTLTIEGESRDIRAEASGASTINAFNLKTENAEVDASGASTVRMFSSVSLKAGASGASSIKYKGNPKVVSNTSGTSNVSKVTD